MKFYRVTRLLSSFVRPGVASGCSTDTVVIDWVKNSLIAFAQLGKMDNFSSEKIYYRGATLSSFYRTVFFCCQVIALAIVYRASEEKIHGQILNILIICKQIGSLLWANWNLFFDILTIYTQESYILPFLLCKDSADGRTCTSWCHLSPVTCHLSPVTCYKLPVIWKSQEAWWWNCRRFSE